VVESHFLDERTARDIDGRVAKLLRDLDNPEPPLELELVRACLELDRAYYSPSDASVLEETVHRLKVAGKQVVRRPGLLLDVVREFNLRALWVPDRKRILLDSEVPKPKQRWNEAHEIGHSLIPWHGDMMHGDKERTLRFNCQVRLEAEANYAAGRLLFLRDAFQARLLDGSAAFTQIRALSKEFGNTMTSGLWRAVECFVIPAFGLVSQHPLSWNPELELVRYFLRSRSFQKRFPNVTASQAFSGLEGICRGRRGPIGEGEVLLSDANEEQHVFHVECFYNGHEALSFGVYQRARTVRVAVP